MKRFILGIVILVAVATVAAPASLAGISIGVKGGVSLSQVNADLFDTDNRTGFVGGVYGAFDLSPLLAIQPELLYVRKGASLFSTDVTIGETTYGEVGTALDVDYMEIPLLLRLSIPTATPVDVRLLAGPVASIKMNERLRLTGLFGYSIGSDQIKTADFGLALGGAVAIRSGSLSVVGEGRYTMGLSNVSDLPFGGDIKNAAIYAMLGLEFPLGIF